MLVVIDGGWFYAAIVVEDGVVVDAAPILAYMVGRDFKWVKRYARKRKFKIHVQDNKKAAS